MRAALRLRVNRRLRARATRIGRSGVKRRQTAADEVGNAMERMNLNNPRTLSRDRRTLNRRRACSARCLCLLLTLAAPVIASGNLESALEALDRGEYAAAERELRALAEAGDPSAQTELGLMFGLGRGVPVDFAEAIKWYRRAARQGDAAGQYNLGVMYHRGYGVKPNLDTAIDWYRRAAEAGDADAQFNLGVMYREGQGVEQDLSAAFSWFHRAAVQGNSAAQSNLGTMYGSGEGTTVDYVQAYAWFHLAASEGNAVARMNRDIAAGLMTPADLERARDLAEELVARYGTQ